MPNLDAVTYQRNHPCSIDDSIGIALDVSFALRYLYERTPSIVHFNVRSENVLINAEGRGVLSGFGLSKELPNSRGQPTTSHAGVPDENNRFRAPEYYSNPSPLPKSSADVYGWAMTALQLVGGKPPFCEESKDFSAVTLAINGGRPKRESYPTIENLHEPDVFWQLLDDCWDQEESKRPTMDAVVVRMKAIRDNQFGRRDPPVVQPRRRSEGIEPADGRSNQGTEQRAPPQGQGRGR